MARQSTFSNKFALVDALNLIAAEGKISTFLGNQLVEKGYAEVQSVKKEGRGRPSHKFVLTGKGRGYTSLAKNWKRPVSTTDNADPQLATG